MGAPQKCNKIQLAVVILNNAIKDFSNADRTFKGLTKQLHMPKY